MNNRLWDLIIFLVLVVFGLPFGVLQVMFPVVRLVWTAFLDLVGAGFLIFVLVLPVVC
jgi:hypothetical protein